MSELSDWKKYMLPGLLAEERAKGRGEWHTEITRLTALVSTLEAERDMARAGAIRDALSAQPCTAANPNEDDYQRGAFDGVMVYAAAIRALPTPDLSGMVEKVAEALWTAESDDDEWDRGPWSSCPDDAKDGYRKHARAVLSAVGVK